MKTLYFFSALLLSVAVLTNCNKDEKTEESTVPVISSINVTSAYVGDTIIISGKNFAIMDLPFSNTVKFNSVEGRVIAATATQLSVQAPIFTTGDVTVTTTAGTSNGLPFTYKPSVFVAGDEWKEGDFRAKYWVQSGSRGGALVFTNGPSNASANSIFVDGRYVHAAGYEINNSGKSVAKYWQSLIATNLSNGTNNAQAHSIFVNGSDVYVAGFDGSVAKYWKITGTTVTSTVLTNGTNNAQAYSIFVQNNDVYVAGFDGSIAKYWKNGVPVDLTSSASGAQARSIFVKGSDVYVAGYEGRVAKYWKNGAPVVLTDGANNAQASSIFVQDNDVYVAGFDGGVAKYWKNNETNGTALTNGANNAQASSIFVNGGDIYVAGFESNGSKLVAKYWKNGVPVVLTNGTNDARATSIVLK